MANVIDFANASQTISFIEETNALAQASGWDVATAVQNLNPEVASNGMRLVGFESQAGAGAVTEFNAGNAADAYASYIESGGLAAGSGAAAQATSIGAGTVALVSSSAVPTGVVGVAAGSAGLACAAAAPIFGAALGAGLYELAPDFWTQVSQTLLPWLWEDLGIMPVVFDESGQTYLPQAAIEALQELFAQSMSSSYVLNSYEPQSSAWNLAWNNYSMPVTFVPIPANSTIPIFTFENAVQQQYTVWIKTGSVATVLFGIQFATPNPTLSTYYWCFLSEDKSVANTAYIKYGTSNNPSAVPTSWSNIDGAYVTLPDGRSVRVQYRSYQGTPISTTDILNSRESTYGDTINTVDVAKLWYNQDINKGTQVEGITEWEGDPYPTNPNTIDVLTGFDELGNPQYDTYQQVALPIGDPLTTNDPLIQPSPYTNPLPEINPDTGTKVYPAIDPYVNPYPSPQEFPAPNDIPEGEPGHIGDPNLNPAPLPSVEEVPQPATEAVPDPAVDPSADPAPESIPENPTQPSGPPSEGTSPTPMLPIFPLFPTGDASLYHVYNPTNAQLQQFGSWLWTTFSGNLIDTLSKLFNNPMDAVISLQEFYGTPNIQGNGTIRCGYLDSEVPSALVGNRYSSINCGTIIIPEYYGNYLDYTPYTQVIVYLPFVGFMSLNADDIIGNAVNITYHVDSYTGSVIAIITVARQGYESVMYQFEGNCSVDVPVTGGQQSSIKGAIIGGISGAVAGGVAGAAVGAVLGGLSSKNDVQHSGSFSASYGAMGAKIPFIVVRRPVQKIVMNYNESYGFPAHKMVYVGACRGYLRAREVRVLSTTATNEEKAMIVDYLLSGVYVKN